MLFKIKTSNRTMEIFEKINGSEHFPPFILSKLSIALSVKSKEPLGIEDFETDNNGLELNRQTITGEYDSLFKALIEMNAGNYLEDDEYLQKYLKAHLDRGALLLESEYRYGSDLMLTLLNKEKGI